MYSAPISAPRLASWPSAVSPGGDSGVITPNTIGSWAWAGDEPQCEQTPQAAMPPKNPRRCMLFLSAAQSVAACPMRRRTVHRRHSAVADGFACRGNPCGATKRTMCSASGRPLSASARAGRSSPARPARGRATSKPAARSGLSSFRRIVQPAGVAGMTVWDRRPGRFRPRTGRSRRWRRRDRGRRAGRGRGGRARNVTG